MGGVYMDMDTKCNEPLDSFIEGSSCIIPKWSNYFMATVPEHPLFKKCIDNLSKHKGSINIYNSTGPTYLKNVTKRRPIRKV